MPWHVAGDHSMIWSARSSRSRISSLQLYDDSFRYFRLRLALHPLVTRAVVPEDLALALVRNWKLHERLDRLPFPPLSLSLLMLTRKKRSGCKSSVQENDVN